MRSIAITILARPVSTYTGSETEGKSHERRSMMMQTLRTFRMMTTGLAFVLAVSGLALAAADSSETTPEGSGGRPNACTEQQIEGGYEDINGECLLTGWNWVVNGQCVSGSCEPSGCLTRMCDCPLSGCGGGGGGGGGGNPEPPDPPDNGWPELMKPLEIYDRCRSQGGDVTVSTTKEVDAQGNVDTFIEIECLLPDGGKVHCISYLDPEDPDLWLLYQCYVMPTAFPAPSDERPFPDHRDVYQAPSGADSSTPGSRYQAPVAFERRAVASKPAATRPSLGTAFRHAPTFSFSTRR